MNSIFKPVPISRALISCIILCTALITACSTSNKSESEKESSMKELTKGEIVPSFRIKDQDGDPVDLDDFKGRKLLIYFYPKASTPGCTAQACSIRDAAEDFSKLNLPVLGISPDGPSAQAKFHQKYNLGFPLLCDEDLAVSKAFGVYKKRIVGDSLIPGIKRSSFLIDEKGRILEAWYGISPADTVPAALKALKKDHRP